MTTPRPWKYDGHGYIWGPRCEMVADFDTDEVDPILRMRGHGAQLPIEENAALIVAAVNAHDALVECARCLQSAVATGSIDTRSINEDATAALSRLPEGTI